MFLDYIAYLRQSNALIDKTYELGEAGAFKEDGSREGREFVVRRLAAGSQKLIDVCYTAWIDKRNTASTLQALGLFKHMVCRR